MFVNWAVSGNWVHHGNYDLFDEIIEEISVMKTAATKRIIGCIGKCTSGLSIEELDAITDNVQKTLDHHQGRKIFREFLRKGKRQDDLNCLDVYEQFCRYIDNENAYVLSTTNPNLKSLTNDVSEAFETAIELNGVPEIDMTILDKFNDVLNAPCRESMLGILEETKLRLADHLKRPHRDFKIYIVEPCPKTR